MRPSLCAVVTSLALGILWLGPGSVFAASPAASALPGTSPAATAPVDLLDPGAEPRTTLRYAYESGATYTMVVDLDIAMAIATGDSWNQVVTVPTIRMVADIQLDDVATDGSVRYDYRYSSVNFLDPTSVDDATVQAMDAQFAPLLGLTGWVIVDDRGRNLDGGINGLEALEPGARTLLENMQRSLAELSAPLPEEPVGVGAKWQTEQHLGNQGIVIDQTSTVTLDRHFGQELLLLIDLSQSAEPGPMDVAGTATGTTLMLVSMAGDGRGTMVVPLHGLVPTSNLTAHSTIIIESEGTRVTTTGDLGFRVREGVQVPPPPTATTTDRIVRASHILFSPNHDPEAAQSLRSSDPAWEAARAEALRAAAELRAIPDADARRAAFEARARMDSDDTGSGAAGGDLGAFTRDTMVPEFGDALFDAVDLQPGDIIGPVRTDWGWHLIMYHGEGTRADLDQ